MDASKKPKTDIEVIARGIRRRSVMSFTYAGNEQLLVEPIALGVHKETGKHVLRCYKSFPLQLSDTAENWYLCELDKISNLKTTPIRSKDFRKKGKTIIGDMSEVIECSPDYEKAALLDKPKKR
jgi:hypothetical protein